MDIHELFKKEDLFQRNRKKTNLHGPLKIFWFYLRKKIIESFFKKVDLISAESKELVGFLIKKYPQLRDKIIYIPNGVDGYYLKNSGIQKIPLHKRDNIILNVCRIGTPYKASEILMEAIGKLRDLKDWKVIYVGSIDEKFHKIREEFFRKHPDLKDKILFIGEVKERKELNKIYQKAKIFCLTSVLGSFEFTLVEALSNGDYIVSSDLPSAKDITKNGAIGTLYKRGDSDELSKILQKIIDDDKFLKELYPQILEYAEKNFFWNKIIQKLYGEILRKRKI
ncbi:MAG: glycosyltransferase family 4 protein [Promethearchaeota archaeon]